MRSMQNKKVALITGSTSGIGKAIVIELAKNDYSVVINGASTKELPVEYKRNLENCYKSGNFNNYLYVQADVGKKGDRELLISKIREKFGRIDVLVNNAGVAPKIRRDVLETTEESYDFVMGINLKGPYFLSQEIAKWMIQLRAKINQEYNPYIINITSMSKDTVSLNRGEYCISKAALTMVTKLFAVRLADNNIPVIEISPGIIDTPMTFGVHDKYDKLIEEGLIPMKRWGKPEDIAKAVTAIVKGLIPYSTGTIIEIDGGFHIKRL